MLPSILDKKRNYKKQVMFLLLRNIHSCYFLQLSSETWRLWVKQRDQSKPPTQTKNDGHKKQNQQTTEESKVYIILSPFHPPPPTPQWKNMACWRKVENEVFLQTRKNNTTLPPPPPPKKNYPPKKSPVQIFHLALNNCIWDQINPVQTTPETTNQLLNASWPLNLNLWLRCRAAKVRFAQ